MARPAAGSLLGAWRLLRWEIVYDGGRRGYPFGELAAGLLIYSADGFMSACIMTAGRPRLSAANPRAAAPAERAAAYDGYFSYAGRYLTAGRRVFHEVEIALNPAMTGTVQVRSARRVGRMLELSADESLPMGACRQHRLLWQRPRPESAAQSRRRLR